MSKGFTALQAEYIENRANGMGKGAAARAAGCAPRSASVQAARWEGDPLIVAAIEAKKQAVDHAPVEKPLSGKAKVVEDAKGAAKTYGIDAHVGDPLALLLAVAGSTQVPLTLRMDAAKTVLPFTNARIGEKTKGQNRKEEAAVVGKGKFGAGDAPRTGNVVGIRKRAS